MNQLDMKGRHAVITGGAAGLGFAIAQRMLASGATVTLWDRDEVALAGAAKALGAGVQTVQVDVTRPDSVVQAVAQTAPKVDALVTSAYSTGKAAVIGLTKSLGKELASTGIRVNCVTPAAVKTAIFDQMTPEHIQFMLSKIPMGRFGMPEEIAAMVAWLCTEDCSFSTGAVFDLSGGRATY